MQVPVNVLRSLAESESRSTAWQMQASAQALHSSLSCPCYTCLKRSILANPLHQASLTPLPAQLANTKAMTKLWPHQAHEPYFTVWVTLPAAWILQAQ